MEFVADITECIILLEGSGKQNEGVLAEQLQECVREFLNLEQSTEFISNDNFENGDVIEDGEITQEEGEIKIEVLDLMEVEEKPLAQIREQFLSCKFCPFVQTLKKPVLVNNISEKDQLPKARQFWHPIKDFRIHIRSEHSMCEICEIRFDNKDNLEDHIDSHNPEEGVIVCNFNGCSVKKALSHYAELFSHAQKLHHGGKFFKCNICTKSFNALKQLRDHDKRHNGEGQYICPICGMAYLKNYFATHLKMQHNSTCSLCKKTFFKLHNLLNHLQIHTKRRLTSQKCFKCNIFFFSTTHLQNHMKGSTHTGLKHFLCNLCRKPFSSKPNVLKHQTKTGWSRCKMLPPTWKKKKRDPKMPKRALNGFLLYCQEERARVKEEVPELRGKGGASKELARRWSLIGPEEKVRFESQACEGRDRYLREKEQFRSKLGGGQ